ncbi:MAG: sialidase family protein [Planctomycetota bacterium]|nr:sialidase family protein [Planctomycetota bacterium]
MLRMLSPLIALLSVAPAESVPAQEGTPGVIVESFDGVATGSHLDLETAVGQLAASERHIRVAPLHPVDAPDDLVLQLTGRRGAKGPIEVLWALPAEVRGGEVLVLDAGRLNRRKGLRCELVLGPPEGSGEVIDLTKRLRVGEFERIHAAVPAGTTTATFRVAGQRGAGVVIERLSIEPARPMRIASATARPVMTPVLPGRVSTVAEVTIETEGGLNPLTFERLEVRAAVPSQTVVGAFAPRLGEPLVRASVDSPFVIEGPVALEPGRNDFEVRIATGRPLGGALPGAEVDVSLAAVIDGGRLDLPTGERAARTAGELVPASWLAGSEVTALVLQAAPVRGASEPVLLLAVEATAPEGPRIGLFRGPGSPEGAVETLTVEGESPVLLLERGTQRARLYFERPGAGRPSCFISEDLGASWSEAPAPAVEGVRIGTGLRLLPGRALTLSTGGWVLPALHELVEGATAPGLLVSRDRGSTWTLSPHVARPMDTASLVELGDGAILADCGAAGRGTRYLASTLDLGADWRDSLSRRRPLLPCSGASSAILHVGRDLHGVADWRLLFLNPSTSGRRPSTMTLVGSNDNGDSWHADEAIILDEGLGCDHPALAMAGKENVLVSYLSSGGVPVAQWIPLLEVVEKPKSLFGVFGGDRPFGR